MNVCVIIPTLNEEEFIGDLVDSINQQSHKQTEIVVVDDGSTDKTVSIAKQKGAKILINNPGRRGPAFGWNRASRGTKADIVCILGADFFLEDKDFIKKSVAAFEGNTVAVYNGYHTLQDTWIEKAITHEYGVSMEPRFVLRSAFLEIGGFPEIGYGEDRVFIMRLERYCTQKNKKITIVKEAFFSGHGIHTLKEMTKQAKWYGKTSLPFIKTFASENPTGKTLKIAFNTYLRIIYFLSFVGLIASIWYAPLLITGIPFLIILLSLFINSLKELVVEKNVYRFARIVLFLLFGAVMFHGLLLHLSGIDKKMGD